jgi:hypothetical protein
MRSEIDTLMSGKIEDDGYVEIGKTATKMKKMRSILTIVAVLVKTATKMKKMRNIPTVAAAPVETVTMMRTMRSILTVVAALAETAMMTMTNKRASVNYKKLKHK